MLKENALSENRQAQTHYYLDKNECERGRQEINNINNSHDHASNARIIT